LMGEGGGGESQGEIRWEMRGRLVRRLLICRRAVQAEKIETAVVTVEATEARGADAAKMGLERSGAGLLLVPAELRSGEQTSITYGLRRKYFSFQLGV
jgi:hypothetical protein